MKESTIKVKGDTIAVYESEGKGQAVLFVHGNSLSAETFFDQLNSELGKIYRFIAIDLPGHGKSSPASDPKKTYSLPGFAVTLANIVKKLKIEDCVLVGHSMGGNVIMEAIEYLEKPAGYFIFGAFPVTMPSEKLRHPFNQNFPLFEKILGSFLKPAWLISFIIQMGKMSHSHPALKIAMKTSPKDEELKELALAFCNQNIKIGEKFFQIISSIDPNFRKYYIQNLKLGKAIHEAKLVANLECPIAIIHGEKEPFVKLDYLQRLQIPTLWRKEVQILPSLGHSPQIENPLDFIRILSDFLEEVSK